MYKPKFFRLWGVAILSVSVLIFCMSVFLVVGQLRAPQVSVILTPDKVEVKKGEAVSVALYFRGADETRISSADIKLVYDKTKLKLEEMLPGPYFVQPVVAGQSDERIALTADPGVAGDFNPELSFVRLRFMPLVVGDAEIGVSPESRVYARGGEATPSAQPTTVTVR